MAWNRNGVCPSCGEQFVKNVSQQRYCTAACKARFYRKQKIGNDIKKIQYETKNVESIANTAMDAGMSYGKWVAQKYIRERVK